MTFVLAGECPRCGMELSVRKRRKDNERFVSCTGWPRCEFAADYDDAVQQAAASRADAGSAKETAGLIKKLIFKFHPDRNGAQLSATDVTRELTTALSQLKAGGR